MNDQENSDLQGELPNDLDPNKSFNEQQPSDLDPTQSNEPSTSTITCHNQPSEIPIMNYASQNILGQKTTICI